MTREKERYFLMIKVSIHQENIMVLNVYTSNNSLKIEAVKSDIGGEEKKIRQIHNYGWKVQHPFLSNWRNRKSTRI